jgi:hypothetical protein
VRLKGKPKLRLLKQGVRLELRLEYQGKQRWLVRLLIELHDRQLLELNNDSNKLKKTPKRVRNIASRLLSRQLQKREQLRSLRVVVRPHVLQQAHHYLNRDTAEQLSSHQNIDSYICQSRPLELITRKYRDSSDRTWLDSLF